MNKVCNCASEKAHSQSRNCRVLADIKHTLTLKNVHVFRFVRNEILATGQGKLRKSVRDLIDKHNITITQYWSLKVNAENSRKIQKSVKLVRKFQFAMCAIPTFP